MVASALVSKFMSFLATVLHHNRELPRGQTFWPSRKKGFFKSDKVIYLSLNRREAELSKPAVLGLARKISNCITFHKTYFGAIYIFTINSEQKYKPLTFWIPYPLKTPYFINSRAGDWIMNRVLGLDLGYVQVVALQLNCSFNTIKTMTKHKKWISMTNLVLNNNRQLCLKAFS